MKNWIGRGLGVCALAAALFSPVARADAAPPARGAEGSCIVVVACGGGWYCCNHCDTSTTTCFVP